MQAVKVNTGLDIHFGYPLYKLMLKREQDKVSDEILQLSEELMR